MSNRFKKKTMIFLFVFGIFFVLIYLCGFATLVSLIFELANSVSADFLPDLFGSCVASFIWGLLYPSVRDVVADLIHCVNCYKKSPVVSEACDEACV